ncbi:MAG TPA: trigger factor [Candidatus Tectomicrobia bacterium]|nr:trigger factor [Candidatus Tectomicrobia bacterium]
MKVEVEELGACARRLEIEIAPENVKKELDQAYRELAKKVSIRGFRKGKIPRPVLERYHRSSVEDEVLQKLIPSSFQQAVKDQGLRAVGQPKLDDINLDEAKALRYTATIEVLPDIALQTYGGWELTKEVRVVTDAEVERELQELQNRHVNLVSIEEDRPVQEGDYVLISFEGFRDGQPVQGSKAENYALVVGSKTVVENVERGLIGMRRGEERDIPVQFPETYQNRAMAGQEVMFHVRVNEIKERVLPPLNDEFAKEAAGVDTLAELREKLRQNQAEIAEREARRALHEVIVTRLVEANPFELPPGMVEAETETLIADLQRQLRPQASEAAPVEITEDVQQQLRQQAITRIKRELLIDEIAKREGMKVDDSDVEADLKRLAERTEQRLEYIRRQMEQAGALESIRHRILADKVLDLVAARSTVTEVSKPPEPEPSTTQA